MKIFRLILKILNIKVAILIFITLISVAIFHERGLLHVLKQRKINKSLEQNIEILELNNKEYKKQIEELKTNKNLIEELARSELGMVKENEIIYQIR